MRLVGGITVVCPGLSWTVFTTTPFFKQMSGWDGELTLRLDPRLEVGVGVGVGAGAGAGAGVKQAESCYSLRE